MPNDDQINYSMRFETNLKVVSRYGPFQKQPILELRQNSRPFKWDQKAIHFVSRQVSLLFRDNLQSVAAKLTTFHKSSFKKNK